MGTSRKLVFERAEGFLYKPHVVVDHSNPVKFRSYVTLVLIARRSLELEAIDPKPPTLLDLFSGNLS